MSLKETINQQFIENNIELIDAGNYDEIMYTATHQGLGYSDPTQKFELLYALSVIGLAENPVSKLVKFQDAAKDITAKLKDAFPLYNVDMTIDVDLKTGCMFFRSNFHNNRGLISFMKVNQDGTYTKSDFWEFKQRCKTSYEKYKQNNNLE